MFVFDTTGPSGSLAFLFGGQEETESLDVISDFTLTGDERDSIDLSALNLLGSGQTATDWIGQNIVQDVDDLVLDLNATSLVLEDIGPLTAVVQDLESALTF